jgi:multiple sugar transport system permease protein
MRHSRAKNIYAYTVLVLWTIIMLGPLYWVLITTFKTGQALGSRATFVPWVDFEPSLQAWRALFSSNIGNWRLYFGNSLIVGLWTALFSTIFGLMGGYALARWTHIGPLASNQVSFLLLMQRMFPSALLAIPMLVIFRELQLLDTHLALIILYTAFNIPFAVWMMTDFVRGIPVEIEESALIDGCSRLGAIFRIVLPLVAPGLVGVFVLMLTFSWNEYFFALILTFGKSVTVPIFVQNQLNSAQNIGWWNVAAIGVTSFLPLAVVALLLERYIRRGLTMGAVK